MPKLVEGELEFDFSRAAGADRMDAQSTPLPTGMKFVDIHVDETSQGLLIEVKDPSISTATSSERSEFLNKLKTKALIPDLTEKARDSYTFLHLMRRDSKPFVYVVVLGLESFAHDPGLLPALKDRLLRRLRQESANPWKRPYVRNCVLVPVALWSKHFARYPLRRL